MKCGECDKTMERQSDAVIGGDACLFACECEGYAWRRATAYDEPETEEDKRCYEEANRALSPCEDSSMQW